MAPPILNPTSQPPRLFFLKRLAAEEKERKTSLQAEIKAQRQPGGLGYEIELRSRKIYESHQALRGIVKTTHFRGHRFDRNAWVSLKPHPRTPEQVVIGGQIYHANAAGKAELLNRQEIRRHPTPNGGFIETSNIKTDRFSTPARFEGLPLYIDKSQAIHTYTSNGIAIKYSHLPLGDCRKVFPEGLDGGVFVNKDRAAAHFDQNGHPKPHLRAPKMTRYHVVTPSKPAGSLTYEFSSADKPAGAHRSKILSPEGTPRFVTSKDYGILQANNCFGKDGRLNGISTEWSPVIGGAREL